MDEYLGARLNHPKEKMHITPEERKSVFGANNARNRDIMSIWTRMGDHATAINILESDEEGIDMETILQEWLDSKKED